MSKKERLKAQKEKQDRLRREAEEQERLAAEEARSTASKAAKKLLKKSAGREHWSLLVLKLLMFVPFLYSGFFHGGVLAAGIMIGSIEPAPPTWVFWLTLIGCAVILAGIIVEFFRKYILGFILTGAGTAAFLRAAGYMIGQITYRLENYSVREGLQGMDREYRLRYYPILGCLAIAAVLLIISLIRSAIARKRRIRLEENAPVKSVAD